MDIKTLWFTFDGRATRSDYWLRTTLPLVGIMIVLAILMAVTSDEHGNSPFTIVYFLFVLFSIVPSLAVSIKRFHDRDMTGWWVLMSLIPIVGSIFIFVVVGCLRGTEGDNTFGPDPLAAPG